MDLEEIKTIALDYEEKVKIALRAVEAIQDETLKMNAFNKILEDLIKSNGDVLQKRLHIGILDDKKGDKNFDETYIDFNPSLFSGPEEFVSLGWREKLLYILEWGSENHKKGGLTTGEIASIFRQRFAQPYILSTVINKEMIRRLVRTTYIRRMKEGKNYRWFITEQGKNYIRTISSKGEIAPDKKG